jgi:hypothetical protein
MSARSAARAAVAARAKGAAPVPRCTASNFSHVHVAARIRPMRAGTLCWRRSDVGKQSAELQKTPDQRGCGLRRGPSTARALRNRVADRYRLAKRNHASAAVRARSDRRGLSAPERSGSERYSPSTRMIMTTRRRPQTMPSSDILMSAFPQVPQPTIRDRQFSTSAARVTRGV